MSPRYEPLAILYIMMVLKNTTRGLDVVSGD